MGIDRSRLRTLQTVRKEEDKSRADMGLADAVVVTPMPRYDITDVRRFQFFDAYRARHEVYTEPSGTGTKLRNNEFYRLDDVFELLKFSTNIESNHGRLQRVEEALEDLSVKRQGVEYVGRDSFFRFIQKPYLEQIMAHLLSKV